MESFRLRKAVSSHAPNVSKQLDVHAVLSITFEDGSALDLKKRGFEELKDAQRRSVIHLLEDLAAPEVFSFKYGEEGFGAGTGGSRAACVEGRVIYLPFVDGKEKKEKSNCTANRAPTCSGRRGCDRVRPPSPLFTPLTPVRSSMLGTAHPVRSPRKVPILARLEIDGRREGRPRRRQ